MVFESPPNEYEFKVPLAGLARRLAGFSLGDSGDDELNVCNAASHWFFVSILSVGRVFGDRAKGTEFCQSQIGAIKLTYIIP